MDQTVDKSQIEISQHETSAKKIVNKKSKAAKNAFISPQDSMFINQISYLTQVILYSFRSFGQSF